MRSIIIVFALLEFLASCKARQEATYDAASLNSTAQRKFVMEVKSVTLPNGEYLSKQGLFEGSLDFTIKIDAKGIKDKPFEQPLSLKSSSSGCCTPGEKRIVLNPTSTTISPNLYDETFGIGITVPQVEITLIDKDIREANDDIVLKATEYDVLKEVYETGVPTTKLSTSEKTGAQVDILYSLIGAPIRPKIAVSAPTFRALTDIQWSKFSSTKKKEERFFVCLVNGQKVGAGQCITARLGDVNKGETICAIHSSDDKNEALLAPNDSRFIIKPKEGVPFLLDQNLKARETQEIVKGKSVKVRDTYIASALLVGQGYNLELECASKGSLAVNKIHSGLGAYAQIILP